MIGNILCIPARCIATVIIAVACIACHSNKNISKNEFEQKKLINSTSTQSELTYYIEYEFDSLKIPIDKLKLPPVLSVQQGHSKKQRQKGTREDQNVPMVRGKAKIKIEANNKQVKQQSDSTTNTKQYKSQKSKSHTFGEIKAWIIILCLLLIGYKIIFRRK